MNSQEHLPKVSVIMPVYNASAYVEKAINSILNQTFINFELLVFNDGSSDQSSEVVRSIKDNRIRFFDYDQNSGYVKHLNEGLLLARGEYIARMDADDIALPERFTRQVALLDNEPKVVLCGTAMETFGSAKRIVNFPVTDKEIKDFMPFNNPIGHPTVMFRKHIVQQHNLAYNSDYMPAEDYKLWYDFSKVGELRNLPEILLHYRVHPFQISSYQNAKQRKKANTVRMMQLIDKGFTFNEIEWDLYCNICDQGMKLNKFDELKSVINFMDKLLRKNIELHAYEPQVFFDFFQNRWNNILLSVEQYSFNMLPLILKTDILSWAAKSKFIAKSLLNWRA